MAEKLARSPSSKALGQKIAAILTNGLKAGGIRARVETEAVPQTKLHRVLVVAPQFKSMGGSERQKLVWRILDKQLEGDDQFRVSMVLTLTPSELKGRGE